MASLAHSYKCNKVFASKHTWAVITMVDLGCAPATANAPMIGLPENILPDTLPLRTGEVIFIAYHPVCEWYKEVVWRRQPTLVAPTKSRKPPNHIRAATFIQRFLYGIDFGVSRLGIGRYWRKVHQTSALEKCRYLEYAYPIGVVTANHPPRQRPLRSALCPAPS
jgi:hypothetical protein